MSGSPSPISKSSRPTAGSVSAAAPDPEYHRPVRTLGIDLAAQPANTSACTIEWGPGRPLVSQLRSGLNDQALLEAITGADKVAIDAPFGWPDEFVEAMSAHRNRAGWPGSGEDQDLYRFRLSFRATDRRLIEQGARRPLSVSTDLIGVVAMRAAYLLDRLAAFGEAVDRAGSGKVVEAYPAPALNTWGLSSTGYKSRVGAARLPQLLSQLEQGLGSLEMTISQRELAGTDHNSFDALVCALVARAAALGLTQPPEPGDEADRATREGWIHVPTNPLPHLLET
jgi:predicted nuclease with RNAse H fold